jgi:hypothetical protein
MIVLIGIRVSTWTTIAAAPARPPPPADFSAFTRSKSTAYDTPRPGIARAMAMGRQVRSETRKVEKMT